MESLGLYIHIPFCLQKCSYCDFVSYPDKLCLADDYIEALIKEAYLYKDFLSDHYIDTIFIGGGTPSLLTGSQIERLVGGLKETMQLRTKEFTVEANPETLTEEKMKAYKDSGINRLSIGLQCHDDAVLACIGRRHTFKDFKTAYDTAAKYFSNINIDIMFGLPGQSFDNFSETIKTVIEQNPAHVSCYALKLEQGTKLYETFKGADEETDRQMYHNAVLAFKKAGCSHYETSNFAKKGFECAHNLKYWKGQRYLGLGVAASSFDGKSRWTNTASLEDYIAQTSKKQKPAEDIVQLTENDAKLEYLMLRLRLAEGINLCDYRNNFGTSFLCEFEAAIKTSEKAGLITNDGTSVKPELKGFDLQNTLISEFMKNI